MKFLYIMSMLIFLYSCQSTASSQNNIKNINLNESRKKTYNIANSSEIKKKLNECQNKKNNLGDKESKYFTSSIFLHNLKRIESMDIYYKDTDGNRQKTTTKPIRHIFEDDFIVISEDKQYNSLSERGNKLANPFKVNFLYIKYIDKNNKIKDKTICINAQDRKMNGNNLFIYENKYYFYNFSDTIYENENIDTVNSKLIFKKIPNSSTLKIHYAEDNKYFYLKILGCHKNNICNEPRYIRNPKTKTVILKFNLNGNQTQKLKNNFFSKYIKRIEIGYHSKKTNNNHLVIESKKRKITNITKMPFSDKGLMYRIEF